MPPVTTEPSHSRTYRSFSPDAPAICWLDDGGSVLIVSNRPVSWPMLSISVSRPPISTPSIFCENACAFASSCPHDVPVITVPPSWLYLGW